MHAYNIIFNYHDNYYVGNTSTLHVPVLDQNVIVIIALVALSILSSITFLLIGCLCGWFGHKLKQLSTNETAMSNESVSLHQTTPTPEYEDVMTCTSRKENSKKESLELSENVAYGTLKP